MLQRPHTIQPLEIREHLLFLLGCLYQIWDLVPAATSVNREFFHESSSKCLKFRVLYTFGGVDWSVQFPMSLNYDSEYVNRARNL